MIHDGRPRKPERRGVTDTTQHRQRWAPFLATTVLAKANSAQAQISTTPRSRSSCFLKGTKIQTADGACKVEDLAIGDMLPTMFDGMRPIQWIGRYPFKKSDPSKPWAKDALPVRIARSALAPDVPRADLYVTEWHALFVDGVLPPARCLINGTTITRYEVRGYDELEFFHIKLESHDVIYAEGASVETLLSTSARSISPSIFADTARQRLKWLPASRMFRTVAHVAN
jgi:Hint domain